MILLQDSVRPEHVKLHFLRVQLVPPVVPEIVNSIQCMVIIVASDLT